MLYGTPLKTILPYDPHNYPLSPTGAPLRPRLLTLPLNLGQNDVASPLPPPPPQTPINSLPAELLIEIFVSCSVIGALAPLALRAVSPRWRDIVDCSPLIWRHISFDDEQRSISAQRHQAEMWAKFSRPLQFDVEVNANNLDNMLPLLSPLLPYIDRWRSFTLTGQREEEVDTTELILNSTTFNHLNISICDWDTEYLEEEDVKATFVPTYPVWPFCYMMNVWMYKLPSPQSLAPLRFTCISITEGSFGAVFSQPRPVLEFLQACPELESFYFSGWPHDEDLSTEKLPVVSLPRLHTLHLKSTCSARAYLSSLNTPHLRNLYLAHLNVDFKLQGEYNEPGDSDDEAGDYSQSPWSDQATGMGLRKLIHRCKPPIKVLEMDFSDMRTKDFRYIFDRLPDLEEFRIVASDMSDTVIRLFKPNIRDDGSVEIRAPRLRQLKLYNCQRLTGDAIVGALVSRVAFTDKNTQGNTLAEVAIVGCEGFAGVHEVSLERTLRKRLRFD
ncbi:hypothetical protein P691DRAFT_804065 [Macrolepiota fuliginosa MF-IS2]|uniref:F-box domain-containing protein n=1 Tax=Macrolepiota fuliginosa MF-IS2 TaxID=1400762 RepID=A0A9P6CB28_9AGAR|nr:hypothetical protein P691DRAFT_804065 [Macrolepiota fuliginosa MF-IS2]